MKSRAGFKSDFSKLDFNFLNIEQISNEDSEDTFKKLLNIFLSKNDYLDPHIFH